MIHIPIYRFRAEMGDVLARTRRGEAVVLTRHGKPVAQLLPVTSTSWYGLSAVAPETHRHPRIRPFRGPGTLSREILRERRRDG